jgi:hypothetical protein
LNLSGTGILPVFKITGKMPVPQSCRLFNPHSLIGRKVDLRTSNELSRYFRQEVIDLAVVQYVQD